MDGFEKNKIIMALLFALLVGMISGKVGDILIHSKNPEKTAINIDGVEDDSSQQVAGPDANVIESLEPLMAKASVANGEVVAKRCLQCHSLDKGGANKIGPNLYGVVGNKLAHINGFAYSSALKAKAEKEKWSLENLNQFLAKPSKWMQGTKMSFAGIKKAQERADLIAFLNTKSDAPISFK